MGTREPAIAREDWLQHAAALRRLAAGLLRDRHEAEDLVQETWLRSRDSAEDRGAPWYRIVLKNLVRDRLRERERRERRERAAAREESIPGGDEIAEQLEVAQRLAAEVARLAEPYRTAVHLRYFEDRSPEEIARACGIPLETARTRLRRGLERLRERMDEIHGGRREAWALALAPLAARHATPAGILATTGAIMGTKLTLTAAATLAVAAGLFLAWPRSRGADTRSETVARADSPQPEEGSELRGRIEGSTATARAEASTPALSSAGPAVAPATAEIHGTVVIEDERDVEHADESGTLWIVRSGEDRKPALEKVDFEHGAWSLRVPADDVLEITRLFVGAREAIHADRQPILPGPEPILVRGRLPARGRLRVVDAETHAELGGIEVRFAEGWRANPRWTHPGDDRRVKVLVSGAASPVELPGRIFHTPYWVHAPGHAWARVDFDHQKGGEEIVELSPAPSAVVVKAVGGDVPAGALVRLYPATGRIVSATEPAELPADWTASVRVGLAQNGTARIDDLEAGSFVAAIEIGELESRVRLGEAAIHVVPGTTASVRVPWDPALLEFPRTHLFGTIAGIPKGIGWGDWTLELQRTGGKEAVYFESLADLSPVPGREGVLAWDAGLVRAGEYSAEIRWIQYAERVDAGKAGETEVALLLTPLTRVTVDVVDARSGEPLEQSSAEWRLERIPGRSKGYWIPVRRSPRTGRLDFASVAGDATLRAAADGFDPVELSRRIEGAEASVRLELRRGTGIRITLREESAALAVGSAYFYDISTVGEDGEEVVLRDERTTATEGTKYLNAPGRYRLEFPKLEGFEPIESRAVVAREGEVVDVAIDVRRSR